jgi:hypothetical protein
LNMVRMDVCQNYPLDVLHFISKISNIGLKLRSKASVNKSQIIWLLLTALDSLWEKIAHTINTFSIALGSGVNNTRRRERGKFLSCVRITRSISAIRLAERISTKPFY